MVKIPIKDLIFDILKSTFFEIFQNITQRVLEKAMKFLRVAHTFTFLKGEVDGLFGGRSIGMGSGNVNPDLCMSIFGVDVEHIDQ